MSIGVHVVQSAALQPGSSDDPQGDQAIPKRRRGILTAPIAVEDQAAGRPAAAHRGVGAVSIQYTRVRTISNIIRVPRRTFSIETRSSLPCTPASSWVGKRNGE